MKKPGLRTAAACLALSFCASGGLVLPAAAQGAECPRIEDAKDLGRPAVREIHSRGAEFRNLNEFSGLTIAPDPSSPGGISLWTIDDEESLAIRLLTTGEIVEAVKIEGADDLEAVAFDAGRERLAVISEQTGRVRFLERQEASGLQEKGGFTLSQLRGYDGRDPQDSSGNTLKDYYENYTQFEERRGERPNSGWEGMTSTGDGRMFFLKEKNPAILIEVTLNEADLQRSAITKVTMLNCGSRKRGRLCDDLPKNAFIFPDEVDVDGEDENLDFSDVAYVQGKLWLTSDVGRSVISFDPQTRQYSTYLLEYAADQCLEGAEGVAVPADGKQLFIINDQPLQEDSRLLIYDLK